MSAIDSCARAHTSFEPTGWGASDACLPVSSQQCPSAILTSAPSIGDFVPSQFRRHNVFAFTWSFSVDTNTLLINNSTSFELHPTQQRNVQGYITAITSDVELPWFNMADTALMANDVWPRHDTLYLQLIRRIATGDAVTYDVVARPAYDDTSNLRPFLTITYPGPATKLNIPIFSFPQLPYSASPSTTLPIRRVIIKCLVPIATVATYATMAAMFGVYVLFWVMVVWLLWFFAFGQPRSGRSGLVECIPPAGPAVLSEVGVDVDRKTLDKINDSKSAVVPGPADNMV